MKKGKTMPAIEIRAHLELRPVKLDNPGFSRDHAEDKLGNLRIIDGVINIRESAIETLYARGALNIAQKWAADKYRGLFEAMGGAGASAIDYSRDAVDGGPARDPISERQVEAGRELKRCRIWLGVRNYELVRKVCGEGKALSDIFPAKRDRLTAADNLRHALDDLLILWRKATSR